MPTLTKYLCYNCFQERETPEGACPYCGFDLAENREKYPVALPAGTVLNGRYIVGRVLGQGGFGVTYLALDTQLNARVAIKEFLPGEIATRIGTTVSVMSGDKTTDFTYGAERFQEEARTLAKFIGHPNIAGVSSYFNENDTSYFVMDYIEGISFKSYIANQGGKVSVDEALNVMIPVLRALTAVHAEGFIHRDVTPDNIYISKDGNVKLLDFGSARYSIGDKSKSLDVVLKVGYAPKEQYIRRGRQGPYTDVYSCAACFYAALTGYLPPESLERMDHDELIPVSQAGIDIPEWLDRAILKGLAVQPEDRFQTAAEFLDAIENQLVVDLPPQPGQAAPAPVKQKPKPAMIAGIAAAVLALVIGVGVLGGGGDSSGGGGENQEEDAPALIKAEVPSITIQGVEYSTDLRTLELEDQGLTNEDIEPLKYMVNLTKLYLPAQSQISDLSPLANLTNLQKLSLSSGNTSNNLVSYINDLSPLAGLTNLESLRGLFGTISDLSFLENLTNLTELQLRGNFTCEDLSPLANLTKLQSLSIMPTGNGVFFCDDLTSISTLTQLHELRFDADGLTSLNGLENLTELRTLELYGSDATYSDVDPLANLTKLQTIRLPIRVYSDGAVPYDIQGLAGLTNLTSLDIPCGVKNLTPLQNLTQLQILSVQNGGSIEGADSSLEPLRNLTNLTELEIRLQDYQNDTLSVDLSPLSGLTKLQSLEVDALNSGSWENPVPSVTNLTALEGLENLRSLTLQFRNVSDISPLRNLKNLQSITIYDGGSIRITDWSPVDHVPVVNK